jgi:alpha-galactosidase
VINKHNGLCLTVQQELEVWAGPVANNSQAVVLLNRGNIGSEPITVKWTDIGFPANKAADVRDLWAQKDLGSFTGNFTSENIAPHSVMMLKITPKP